MSARIPVVEKITKANDQIAQLNRARLDQASVLGLNLLASPGAGKTSVIERTLMQLRDDLRIGVVEGDVTGVIDAERVADLGAQVVQINTGGACHLDASMMRDALDQLPLHELDLVLVENVGNLICPASFALGTHHDVVVASVPEGDDKPYKYPKIYRGIDVLILNKIDLMPYVPFDLDYFTEGVRALNEHADIRQLSCVSGEGLEPWVDWVRETGRQHITGEHPTHVG